MDHFDFDEIAREFGLSGDSDGVTRSDDGYQLYNMDPVSEYTDEIGYSSPSPPERRRGPPRTVPQHSFEEDITQFGQEDYGGPEFRRLSADGLGVRPNVPISTYRTPHFRAYNDTGGAGAFNRDIDSTLTSRHRQLPYDAGNGYRNPIAQNDLHHDHAPLNANRIRLRPVSELPDIYRGIFKFGVFNAVQSSCFDTAAYTDENLVISAPTGSGKTVLFELAVIRMLSQASNKQESVKCVYMAPTKALCSERYRDWTAKFQGLGLKCCELTGDTVQFGKSAWGDAKDASIIITTSEKWDSLTRNWREHNKILSQIQLFLVDEVHVLNDTRGSTLEVVISRMKLRGSAVRFVLVSATAPNIDDIASWIGCRDSDRPATVFQFGEEFRPCKLARFVHGVNRPKGMNDFLFARHLDYRVFEALVQHTTNKPVLIFVSTRKGTFTTAEQLVKDYTEAANQRQKLPWTRPTRIDHTFQDKRLGDLATSGIGVHHAGLTTDDRRAVESLFLGGILRVVVATSTLAVGVNLPAHTVVIKGVYTFQNGASVEYSDLEIMQMLGRAGRPQFDKDGNAIILCETDLEHKYKSLVQGKTTIESSLHRNLSEHLNSEIGLGTIKDTTSAKSWLRHSFLYQRIRKNPNHYSLGKEYHQTWEEKIGELVSENISKLQKTELVAYTDKDNVGLKSTEYGDIMSKFYIRQSTMGSILALPPSATMREMLETISTSEELMDTKLRSSEKQIYNKLRRHNDIRFEVKKVETTSDKVFILIQAVLGGVSLNAPEYKSADSQLQLDAFSIFRHLPRILRAVVEVAIVKKHGAHMKYGLELIRCLTAKAWENRPIVLRQIEHLGEKSIKVLAENGVTSIDLLRKEDPLRIERLLNRRPPFGLEVISAALELPNYSLNIAEVEVQSGGSEDPIQVTISITCGLMTEVTSPVKAKKQKNRSLNMTSVLTLTSDMDYVDFRRIQTKALKTPKVFEVTAELTKPSQSIVVYLASESVSGVTISRSHKPVFDAKKYPVLNTRPKTSTAIDLEGLEDDPDFWNIDIDEIEDENATIKDLTARLPAPPKRRPNGNYECNHTCKDKTKCRHMCCRDGMPDLKKQTINDGKATRPKVTQKENTNMKPKKIAHKADRRLQDLHTLHQRTDVVNRLRLPEGGRLKCEGNGKRKANQRPAPNFNIKLADLGDRKVQVTDPGCKLVDDDDLPEPSDLLKTTKRMGSSDTSYDASEVDALIRDMPLDEPPVEEHLPHTSLHTTPLKRKATVTEPLLSPAPSLKRKREDLGTGYKPKRTKSCKADKMEDKLRSPGRPARDKTMQEPDVLFLPDSETELLGGGGKEDKPDENTSFSWKQVSSRTLHAGDGLQSPTLKFGGKESNSFLQEGSHKPAARTFVLPAPLNFDEELADLEAWLHSGAVRIV